MHDQHKPEDQVRGSAAYNRRVYRQQMANPVQALKLRVRSKCRYAIIAGKLIRQPCEQCGASKVHAHHDDYSKPFDVRWLCQPCHEAVHRKTHCAKGHELTPENLQGGRHCRTCGRLRAADKARARRVKLSLAA